MGVLFDVGPSETRSGSPDGHLRSITGLSLAGSDPDGQCVVNVWVDDGHGEYVIGTLSSEARILAVRPPVLVNDEALVRHDGVAATVRFYGGVHDPPPPSVAGAEESRVAITDDVEVEATVPEEDGGGEDEVADEALWVEFDPPNEEDEAERYDSDNDEEDEGDGVEEGEPSKDGAGECSKKASLPLVAAPPGTVVPDGQFLGPVRFAAVENTAGFMRLAASEVAMDQDRRNEILVLYRYTRFSRTWSGRRGVEVCRRTKLHRLRFAVPPAGDMASSLAWAGASLGPLIYPALFCRQLQELWTILAAAPPLINNIPPQATRIQVIVDVGILRREDNSPERMEYMRGALEAKMQEAWPVYYHVGMELHLPELVRHEEEEQGGGDDTRPLKRRKIVDDEEECSVCLDPLERGLAAWPGCRHVFHGACVEKTLARSDMCPLCRNKLCRLVLERRCYPLETD